MELEQIQKAAAEIAEYSKTDAGLIALRERMAGVAYDLTTTKGMSVAKADRAEVRGLRTGLETTRKAIKAPALAHCKLIDDEAKRITAELLKLEEPIDQQIKARETEIEEARLAKEAAERDRINGITRRIDDLRIFATNAAKCRTSAAIQTLIDNLAAIEMTGFAEFEDEALAVRKSTMEAMEAVLLTKQEEEAERARQAEAAAKQAEEQAAATAQLKKEREELEAARKAQEAETARNRAAAIAEADRLATERQRQADEAAAQRKAEQDAIDAQRAKELEEINKQRAELAEQQAAFEAQQAALTPVIVERVEVALPGGQYYSTTTFKDNGDPILCNADGARSIFCDIADDDISDIAPTEADIYAMGMESPTAHRFAPWICKQAGIDYPPQQKETK